MQYKIEPAETALLVIDAQQEYFSPDGLLYTPNARAILPNLQRLVSAARSASILRLFIRHVHATDGSDIGRMADFDDAPVFSAGTPGVEITPELETDGCNIIDKTRYSAFVGTSLEAILKEAGIETLLITGLMTQYCSVTTARHAHDLDYKVVFLVDANAGPDLPDLGFGAVPHAAALPVIATALAGGIADVVTTNELLEHFPDEGELA